MLCCSFVDHPSSPVSKTVCSERSKEYKHIRSVVEWAIMFQLLYSFFPELPGILFLSPIEPRPELANPITPLQAFVSMRRLCASNTEASTAQGARTVFPCTVFVLPSAPWCVRENITLAARRYILNSKTVDMPGRPQTPRRSG